ncbi:MAG TPA: hypothetical protein VI455_12390 [Terriglobia bacterium]
MAEHVEAEVKYGVLPVSHRLSKYEQLVVTSRVKECESAPDALRRRQVFGTFDTDRPTSYSLTDLKDLAGVRILAFPSSRLADINRVLRKRFPSWQADPVVENGRLLAFKYSGYCQASDKVRGEYQIVSTLIGLFWEVEHAAIYKPAPELKGIARDVGVRERISEAYRALGAFEEEFEAQIAQILEVHRRRRRRRRSI